MLQHYYQGDFTSKCFVTTCIWVSWFPCDGTSHKAYRSPYPLTLLWPSYPQNICVVTLIKCTGKECAAVSACRGEGVCRCPCLWRRGSVQIPVSVEERECADVSDCGEERVCRCACLWRSVCRFQCLWRCLQIQVLTVPKLLLCRLPQLMGLFLLCWPLPYLSHLLYTLPSTRYILH